MVHIRRDRWKQVIVFVIVLNGRLTYRTPFCSQLELQLPELAQLASHRTGTICLKPCKRQSVCTLASTSPIDTSCRRAWGRAHASTTVSRDSTRTLNMLQTCAHVNFGGAAADFGGMWYFYALSSKYYNEINILHIVSPRLS